MIQMMVCLVVPMLCTIPYLSSVSTRNVCMYVHNMYVYAFLMRSTEQRRMGSAFGFGTGCTIPLTGFVHSYSYYVMDLGFRPFFQTDTHAANENKAKFVCMVSYAYNLNVPPRGADVIHGCNSYLRSNVNCSFPHILLFARGTTGLRTYFLLNK